MEEKTYQAVVPATLTIRVDANNQAVAKEKIDRLVEEFRLIGYHSDFSTDVQVKPRQNYEVEEWINPF